MASSPFWIMIWIALIRGTIDGQQDGSAVITIQNEPGNHNYFRPITISSEIFERFSLCVCNRAIGRCVLKYSKTQENVTHRTINGSSQSLYSDYFTCQHYQFTNNVTCIRQTSSSLMCPTNAGQPTSPKQVSILSCNNGCVGIIWNSDQESLKHNQVNNKKTYTCGDKCGEENPTTKSITSTSTSESITIKSSSTDLTTKTTITRKATPPTAQGSITTATTTTGGITIETLTSNSSSSASADSQSQNDSDTTPIIIGVVIALIAIIIVIGLVVFILRRKKQRALKHSQNHRLNAMIANFLRNEMGNRPMNSNSYERGMQPPLSSPAPGHEVVADDYDYTLYYAGGNADIDYSSKTKNLENRSNKVNNNTENPTTNVPDDGYSSIHSADRPNVYSKLGEKVRNITNPYDALLNPKEDAKSVPPLVIPSPPMQLANERADTYSLAQPLSDVSNNQKPSSDNIITGTDANQAEEKDPTGAYYEIKDDYSEVELDSSKKTNAEPEYALVNKASKKKLNPYFELETEEYDEDEPRLTSSQNLPHDAEQPYFELEKTSDLKV